MNALAVFIGGGLGSLARYGVGWGVTLVGWTTPIGTLISNVLATALLLLILGQPQNPKTPSFWQFFRNHLNNNKSTFVRYTISDQDKQNYNYFYNKQQIKKYGIKQILRPLWLRNQPRDPGPA